MTSSRFIRGLLVSTLSLVALSAASRVGAQCGEGGLGCPNGGNSTMPFMLALVGQNGGGIPDPAGEFVVTVRDLANNPLANAVIRIQLAATDVALCSSQQAGLTLPAPGAVEGLTNAAGQFRASIMGSGAGPASHVVGGPAAAQVFANGVLLGTINVTAVDLDGFNGVGINDLSVWLTEFGSPTPYLRGDFDISGAMGVNDLSVWLTIYGKGQSAAGCTP